jgi:Domain of unknown function (DUF4499)
MIQVKAPQITHFEVPFQIWTTGSLLFFLLYTTSIPQHSTSSFWSLAHYVHNIFSDTFFNAVWAIVGIVHLGEGAYATMLARKHNMPWHAAVRVPFLFCFLFPLCHRRVFLLWHSRA